MAMQFRKAEKKKAKLRLGISGPSGAGKTYSALLMGRGLTSGWEKIAVIDTENGSADLYASLGDYAVCTIQSPYTPEKYIEAMKAAEDAGFEVIIIDSLSHAWVGEGGLLDIHGKIADSGKTNSFAAWRTVTPRHNLLVEKILQSKCHVIVTVRSKTEYVLQENEKGKKEPKKIGMAPQFRDGLEYEVTVFMDLDQNHVATVTKDRTNTLDGQYFKPTTETGKTLLVWLESGVEAPPPPQTERPGTANQTQTKPVNWPSFWTSIKKLGFSQEEVHKHAGLESISHFNHDQAAVLYKELTELKAHLDKQGA